MGASKRRGKKLIRHLPLPCPPAESIDLLIQISRQGGPMGGGQHLIDLHHGLGQFVLGPQDKNRLLFAYFWNGYFSILSGNSHSPPFILPVSFLFFYGNMFKEKQANVHGAKKVIVVKEELLEEPKSSF
jgi:hypothetical protein